MNLAKVFLIDDDISVRRGLTRLLRSAGYEVETFASASDYLSRPAYPEACCLVLDVRMPELTGLDLQRTLRDQRRDDQIVFITGHADVTMSVQAMKAGAVDFLPKPFREEALLQAVEQSLMRSFESRKLAREKDEIMVKIQQLTPRENEVMRCVAAGFLNKQTAARLGTSEKTIKVHRSRVMEKLRIESVADLVRLVEKAGIDLEQAAGQIGTTG